MSGQEPLLTEEERAVTRMAGDLWNALCGVIGDGRTREADCAELIVHIHAIQHAVMAQAAARAYPEVYRLLGGSVREPEPEAVDPEAIRRYWTEGPGADSERFRRDVAEQQARQEEDRDG